MARLAPTQVERDDNLKALKAAFDEWVGKEQVRLDNEVKFLRAVLQGRGMSSAAARNLQKALGNAVTEINQFMSYR